jgi:hypothetical protein
VFFAITFIGSFPALFLYEPLLKHANYTSVPAPTRASPWEPLGRSSPRLPTIATAVVLYPILKRQSQSISLGYVASRTLESTVIGIGIVSVLPVVNPAARRWGNRRSKCRITRPRRTVAGCHP